MFLRQGNWVNDAIVVAAAFDVILIAYILIANVSAAMPAEDLLPTGTAAAIESAAY